MDINVLEFIASNKDNTREKTSIIKETLKNAPCYITQVKHGGKDYYKIYFKDINTKTIKNTLLIKSDHNTKNVIEKLITRGGVLKQENNTH